MQHHVSSRPTQSGAVAERRRSRRQFLQLGTGVAGALLAGCQTAPRGRGRRVLVVGAGFAGLACAHELRRRGVEVIVLEARERVGGRVLTFPDFARGNGVEGGGELVGSNHRTWRALARRVGLAFLPVTEDETRNDPLWLEGHRLDPAAASRVFAEMETAVRPLTRLAETVDADQPWRSPDAAALDRLSVADWLVGETMSPECRAALVAQLGGDNNMEVSRQSLLGLLCQIKGGGLERYWTDSEVWRCRGGNQQLALRLARAIGLGRVHLNRPLNRLTLHEDRVLAQAGGEEVFEADAAVLTVPPSVWGRIQFDPVLPEALRPQMGAAVKFLSNVGDRFWQPSAFGPNAYTDGLFSETWEATDGQSTAGGIVLTTFSGGPAAQACQEAWRASGAGALKAQLEAIHPGYAAHCGTTRFMDWPADGWTRAGYSVAAPGELLRVGPLLRAGLGRLHFAGEYACPAFAGYMEGALRSGVAVAQRLAGVREPPGSDLKS